MIVVDDGSSDETTVVARRHGARVISLNGVGPAAARNAGAEATSAPLLVFLDADCVPQEGCLEALLAPLGNPTAAAVRGAYTTHQTSRVARFVQLELDEKQERLAGSSHAAFVDTACAAFRRDQFTAYGGFNEGFTQPSAEDVDISFRLAAGGEILLYAPNAVVDHRHPERLRDYFLRKFRFGISRARVYERYPARLRGDGYTPRLMPLQIALAPAVLASGLASLAAPSLWPVSCASALAFLATTLPLSRRAQRTQPDLVLLVAPMLAVRSLAQAAGLLWGLRLLLTARVGSSLRRTRAIDAAN